MKLKIAVVLMLVAGVANAATRNVVPQAANEGNLGTSALPWAGVNADSAAVVNQLAVGEGASVSTITPTAVSAAGTLGVAGATSLNGAVNIGDAAADILTIKSTNTVVPAAATIVISTVAGGTGTTIIAIDGTNKRVGIGSAAPTVTLDVTGSASVSALMTCSSCTVTNKLTVSGTIDFPADSLQTADLGAGTLPADVIASSVGAGVVVDANMTAATYTNVTVPAANVAAGSLGVSVMVSSVAAGAVGTAQISASAAPTVATLATTARLTVGTILNTTRGTQTGIGASSTVVPTSSYFVLTSTGGQVSLTSTPSVSTTAVTGLQSGTILVLSGTSDTNYVTLSDDDTVAGSLLELGATTRDLKLNDKLTLIYDDTSNRWCEIAYIDLN